MKASESNELNLDLLPQTSRAEASGDELPSAKRSQWKTAVYWLVRDTFRQSLAYGIFWILLGVSVLAIGVCASAGVQGSVRLKAPDEKNPDFLPRGDKDAKDPAKLKQSGVVVVGGDLTLAFGAIRIPLARDDQSAVHFLELVLAGGVADTLGLLLALVWTAGFLPGFLDGRNISVLLAKPAPRWMLLFGKYIGVLTFVFCHATLFVGGTWLAIGLRTHIWDPTYLWCIPLLLLHFAVFFSVSLPAGGLHAEHGRVRVRLDSVLVHDLGLELRSARPRSQRVNGAGRALFVARDGLGQFGLLDSAEAGRFQRAAVQRLGR